MGANTGVSASHPRSCWSTSFPSSVLVRLHCTEPASVFSCHGSILSAYYTISSTTRLIFRNTRLSVLPGLFGVLQSFAVPALFLVCLNIYSMPADGGQPLIATTVRILKLDTISLMREAARPAIPNTGLLGANAKVRIACVCDLGSNVSRFRPIWLVTLLTTTKDQLF